MDIQYSVTTLAGSGTPGFLDGPAATANFDHPSGVAVDSAGVVYVAERVNCRIRTVSPAGIVATLAGSGVAAFADGTGTAASFAGPVAVAVDAAGKVYVADTQNNRIRTITPAGVVTTLAGSGASMPFAEGTGAAATFFSPSGVAVDAAGNVYVADAGNNRIRAVTPAGVVTTLAGSGMATFADGTGAAASFAQPTGVALDRANNIYVPDGSGRIRKVTTTGVVTTLAGMGGLGHADGPGAAAQFFFPSAVAADAAGNVYVADEGDNRIRAVTSAGFVTTAAGSGNSAFGEGGAGLFADGVGTAASFNVPSGVAVDAVGYIYVADSQNYRIRKIRPVGKGEVSVVWDLPANAASATITGYAATASAAGQSTQTCSTTGMMSCILKGLTSGVTYSVLVVATSAAGPSTPSVAVSATPN